jgi:hypothetical protein
MLGYTLQVKASETNASLTLFHLEYHVRLQYIRSPECLHTDFRIDNQDRATLSSHSITPKWPRERRKDRSSISPELWQRVFFQHSHPNSLWTTGRQVCSMWRSEIPKVFARKYLENPDMVQIYFDCGTSRVEGVDCQVRVEMVFDRYEAEADTPCVFREHPLTTGRKTAATPAVSNCSTNARSLMRGGQALNDTSAPTPMRGKRADDSTSPPTRSGSSRKQTTPSF